MEDSYTQTNPTVRDSPYCENLEKKFKDVYPPAEWGNSGTKAEEVLNETVATNKGLKEIISM